MPRVYIKTHGCQMNERDAELVSLRFIEREHSGQIFEVRVSGFENFTLYVDAILSD